MPIFDRHLAKLMPFYVGGRRNFENMSNPVSRQHGKGKADESATESTINTGYEIRKIVVARGIEGTDKDIKDAQARTQKKCKEWEDKLQQAKAAGDRKAEREAKESVYWYKYYCRVFPMWVIPDDQGKIMHKVPLKDRGSSHEFRYEYNNDKQQVIYRIQIVQTKHEFKKWLQTPSVHVIYAGHSRYGRGACFGATPNPGDRWEDGTGCTTGNISKEDGLLRLGFDLMGIPITDIHHHHYHTRPFRGQLEVNKKTCHPQIVKMKPIRKLVIDSSLDVSGMKDKSSFKATHEPKWGYWKWDSSNDCIRIKPTFDLASMFYQDNPNQGVLWGYRKRNRDGYGPNWRLQIVLQAGWKDTTCSPWELDKVDLKCKVFCHFGCSSFKHFHPIVRGNNYNNWKKSGTGADQHNFAYFTTRPSNKFCTSVWLQYVLTYPYLSKGKSWEPCLEWARKKANRDLTVKWKQNYKII